MQPVPVCTGAAAAETPSTASNAGLIAGIAGGVVILTVVVLIITSILHKRNRDAEEEFDEIQYQPVRVTTPQVAKANFDARPYQLDLSGESRSLSPRRTDTWETL